MFPPRVSDVKAGGLEAPASRTSKSLKDGGLARLFVQEVKVTLSFR
jgi:hypothetical protein